MNKCERGRVLIGMMVKDLVKKIGVFFFLFLGIRYKKKKISWENW